MKPRALTPLFRCAESWFPPTTPEGLVPYPAPASGNHSGEALFLAFATLLLTASWAIPASSFLSSFWLRGPVIAVCLFLIPQVAMALTALVSPWLAGQHFSREAAQDWCCLAIMTAWAATHFNGDGWGSTVCKAWLFFAGLNLIVLPLQLKALGNRTLKGPAVKMDHSEILW